MRHLLEIVFVLGIFFITNVVVAGVAFVCLYPFACAFTVGALKISIPAINEFCAEYDSSRMFSTHHAWLRKQRRQSRLKSLWPLLPMLSLYLFFASLYFFLAIGGTYFMLTGQSEKIRPENLVMGLMIAPIHLVTLFYLVKIPRQLWVLDRKYRVESRTVK